MRKPAFCICENKGADQLGGDRADDQRLCFRIMDEIIKFLFWLSFGTVYSPVCIRPGWKPRRQVFLRRGSEDSCSLIKELCDIIIFVICSLFLF